MKWEWINESNRLKLRKIEIIMNGNDRMILEYKWKTSKIINIILLDIESYIIFHSHSGCFC